MLLNILTIKLVQHSFKQAFEEYWTLGVIFIVVSCTKHLADKFKDNDIIALHEYFGIRVWHTST